MLFNLKNVCVLVSVCFFSFIYGAPTSSENDVIVLVSPQKTGTHLLTKAIHTLLGKGVIHWWWDDLSDEKLSSLLLRCTHENVVLHTHAYPLPHILDLLQEFNAKVIFLMRDPRDQIVSLLYWVKDKKWPGGPGPLIRATEHYSKDELLYELISGENFGISYTKTLMGCRLGWMEQPFVFTTHFEKLVGEKGGGSKKSQFNELEAILNYLGCHVETQDIQNCVDTLFGSKNVSTFRNGLIGNWKTHFKAQHTEVFKRVFGEELIMLGYEKNFDWHP